MDLDQTAPNGADLIRAHGVRSRDKIWSDVNLSVCSRRKKQTFSGRKKKYWQDKGLTLCFCP